MNHEIWKRMHTFGNSVRSPSNRIIGPVSLPTWNLVSSGACPMKEFFYPFLAKLASVRSIATDVRISCQYDECQSFFDSAPEHQGLNVYAVPYLGSLSGMNLVLSACRI